MPKLTPAYATKKPKADFIIEHLFYLSRRRRMLALIPDGVRRDGSPP
jgi:hypothetical protein